VPHDSKVDTRGDRERGREMKTAAGHTRVVLWLFASAAGLMLATAGTASAQPPITGTEVSTFSDSFSGTFECQDELYTVSVNGYTVVHFTYFEETGALYFHLVDHGKAVAIPLDGTGPSYTSNFFDFDLEGIRAVKHGDVLVEEDTDLFRTVAHGSDGSRVFFYFHAHFTVNANGETTVQLETDKLVCT
jgi:hypothetical protein